MRAALILVTAVLLAHCAATANRDPHRYFVLEAAYGPGVGRHSAISVHVASTSVSNFYDTQDIVYSRTPGTRAYYQFNHWTERPHQVINAQLASRLDAGATHNGPILNTHLEEIYHDAVAAPGMARIEITAELIDPANESVLARRAFSRAVPAASYDAPGAVRGFSKALGALLDDVVAWVDVVTGQ